MSAPISHYILTLDVSSEREHLCRIPTMMIFSIYCYHHASPTMTGHISQSVISPPKRSPSAISCFLLGQQQL